jgi:hypothetical protein
MRASVRKLTGVLAMSALMTMGVVALSPSMAFANPICQAFWDANPGTYYGVSCKAEAGTVQYRAVVECTRGTTVTWRYGSWQTANGRVYGPWSVATCPSGYTRTWKYTDWYSI